MTLYVLAGILLALGIGGFWLYRVGRSRERGKQAQDNAEVKDEQLDAATRRPRDRRELADRLRRNGF